MGSLSAAHLIYIPLVLIIGVVVGFVLGGRAARDAMAMEEKNRERRAAAKAEREARAAAAKAEATEQSAKS